MIFPSGCGCRRIESIQHGRPKENRRSKRKRRPCPSSKRGFRKYSMPQPLSAKNQPARCGLSPFRCREASRLVDSDSGLRLLGPHAVVRRRSSLSRTRSRVAGRLRQSGQSGPGATVLFAATRLRRPRAQLRPTTGRRKPSEGFFFRTFRRGDCKRLSFEKIVSVRAAAANQLPRARQQVCR